MREIAGGTAPLTESVVCELHRRIVARSQPAIAGIYSPHARRVLGSAVIFPNPAKVPDFMQAFGERLKITDLTPDAAFDAHFDLASIHPFADGNGRAARLLMNLMLIRSGYPPIAIRPEDRAAYLASLEQSQLSGDRAPFNIVLAERLDTSLADYNRLIVQTLEPKQ